MDERQASGVRARGGLSRGMRAGIVACVALLAFALLAGALAIRDARLGDRFDVMQWQRTAAANKWLWHIGAPLRNDPSPEEALAQYFMLSNRDTLEARALRPAVEAAIEGRIDAVLQEMGFAARGIRVPGSVFPPVNVQLVSPPRILVESPRAEIRRVRTELLRPDLTSADAVRIERESEERRPDRAALVVGVGGLATYPAIVNAHRSYETTVATAAHEWAHHYLVFYPLGYRYFGSQEAQVINETVADVIGEEVARAVLERWGDPTRPEEEPTPEPVPAEADLEEAVEETPEAEEAFDYFAVLRSLRLDVDALLEEGRVEEAEQRMGEVRDELAEQGFHFRRINQAFFAWFGTYAGRPDSVDPLGGQIAEIRDRAGTLPEFVRLIQAVSTRAEVETLLEELRNAG
jgi:hypothetical protein